MAPVMSSVTVASCVRSPSATVCSSFISRKNGRLVGVVDALGFLLLALGFQPLAFRHVWRFAACPAPARKPRPTGAEPRAASDSTNSITTSAGAQAGLRRQLVLQVAPASVRSGSLSARMRGLRFARGHQALQVAQDGAGLRAGLFVHLQQRFELLARLRVLGAGQAQLGTAVEQALGDFLEGVQVLAEQEHGLGAHAFDRQEFVGRLADALRQHHQLAGGGDLGRVRVLLQLERRRPSRRFPAGRTTGG